MTKNQAKQLNTETIGFSDGGATSGLQAPITHIGVGPSSDPENCGRLQNMVVNSYKAGSNGRKPRTIRLGNDEYINRVEYATNTEGWLCWLRLTTNMGASVSPSNMTPPSYVKYLGDSTKPIRVKTIQTTNGHVLNNITFQYYSDCPGTPES